MPTPHGFVERLAELSQSGTPFVCVTMVEAVGSTPQDAGSKMLVTAGGLNFGTVGGGRVEAKAIEVAKSLLAGGQDKETGRQGDKEREDVAGESPGLPVSLSPCLLQEWNLKRDVGMTCGGTVKLFFESYNHAVWRVVIFGAGHVAAALVECLRQLECQVTCIDPRAEWIDRVPENPRLRKLCISEPRSLVAELPSDAFVICMTMGHATDRPILEEIFRQGRVFPFLGVIGSRAKRAVLMKELAAAGVPREAAERFHCPIGLDIGSNQPGEIAVSVVAQLIQERDRLRDKETGRHGDKEQEGDASQPPCLPVSLSPGLSLRLRTRRFEVVEQAVTRRDGQRATVTYVKHRGSVAILPIVDDEHVCLIKSRRITVNEWLVEVPAGTREVDEPPEETARRELIEETGYRAGRIEELTRYYPSPGIMNEMMYVYVADGLTSGEPAREPNEEIENFVVRFDEALAMIDRGEIHDGKTIVALLAYARNRRNS